MAHVFVINFRPGKIPNNEQISLKLITLSLIPNYQPIPYSDVTTVFIVTIIIEIINNPYH